MTLKAVSTPSNELAELEAADRAYVLHPSTHLKAHAQGLSGGPQIINGAQGATLRDAHGNEFLDAFAGLYCVNIGYGRTEVADAIARQAHELAYYHAYAGYSNEPLIELSERLVRMAPPGMSRVYYGMSGSDANETQIKLVWYYNNILGRTSKKKIISRWRGYHGSGLMTGSLTGLELFHKKFDLPLDRVFHTQAPFYFRRDDLAPLLAGEPGVVVGTTAVLRLPPPSTEQSWVEEEFGRVDFPDARLRPRLLGLAQAFSEQPIAPIPLALHGNASQSKAAYRFFKNPQVDLQTLLHPHYEATAGRIRAQPLVLVAQDTTSLNYEAHANTRGLGSINTRADGAQGLKLHDTLAL
ncbi:MAG: aminotransferase class III-fold pyridoxal phosphate-dependent enzyme, partial [Acidihalobacter sp.]